MELTERVKEWQAAGRSEEFRGHQIHVYEQPGEGTPVLLLHGFPSSSYDWKPLLEVAGEELGRNRRAHVVGDQEERLVRQVPLDQLFDQVRLPAERVDVVAWLVREPEAEKVQGEHVAVPELRCSEQRLPVV